MREEKILKHERSCKNCIKGTLISVNGDILCSIKGAVSPDYVCSKHRFMPIVQLSGEGRNKCADCEFFILMSENKEEHKYIGLCQLFTVRQFNGLEKNACSKFSKRNEREVS
ncbi:hypothetical protein CDQ84_15570 [Clostridium thermosuccinogenes]|jgi:hypothetical protein|uniref:Uncharacterized protein n=1 Tax=Clostridium thermosuccinogenes TaxID=84032 RepID=A0A2K2EXK0_9CLOT|nr:hypothetical protein CDO33_17340 [Pseudoclostridium thermosuccinogenes]PNT91255.1 hypothetical protein CDQ83_15735 [Pseudoclostridium thermosuccinogenes]PNT95275.1 hypothetical protein CDQ85_15550 [Pseudoclostridium thermosuccinogenes]PNT96305.1 hypothetical protein CDQ84_15570 [Pseudoclostridium thermosuccinogenes]